MSETVRQIRVHGRSVRVAHRSGTGVPLVVCNGIGASLDLLQPFVDALDESIPVIRFDVPGIGGSDQPRCPYSFVTLARTLGKVLDELGVTTFDVLGISWGGGLAQQVALQNPRRCRRLVLVSTGTGAMMVPGHPKVLSKMLTPRRYRDPEYAASVAATLYGGEMREDPELAERILDGHAPRTSGRGYRLQLLAGTGWSSLPYLPLLPQRTLIMAGDDDPIIPLINARIMHRAIRRSQLHVYPDGHLALVSRAWDLAPRVARFLRED